MKRIWALAGLILAVCLTAAAQENTGDRVVVPARNSSRPRTVSCSLATGTITVKTYNGKDVIVESGHPGQQQRPAPNGMRRLNPVMRGLEVVEEDNQITVRNSSGGRGDLVITVPVDTSLRLRDSNGAIKVDGVHGEVDVHSLNGAITLTNISGTVTADSQNGPITVSMDRVDPGKPLAFSTLNGEVNLTFPADLKANLSIRTNHGAVYSDYDVTLGGTRAVTEKNGTPDGQFRIRLDNTIRGTINGGGADLTIRTYNGAVYIKKKK